ncbi:MAG: NAD(P)H-dependent oxidoreductase subunit E [Alphaproteobacteria bacterium]|nr:NAD(P)H-dependent oxidoreductase subunit E [Alphaproteobacteria bacterium]
MEKEQEDQVRTAAKKWAKQRGSLVMALHEVQGALGFVPWDAARIIAEEMDVPLARIYEVVSFYSYFKLEKPGDVVISICDGTACHIKGSPGLIAAFEKDLSIACGTSTEDGMFHLQAVRCIGCCGLAPAVVVNGKTYGKVKPPECATIVKEWKAKMKDKMKDKVS